MYKTSPMLAKPGGQVAEPQLAATLVLVRERAPTLEVLLLRRRKDLRFAPGEWTFPGGRVDTEDNDRSLLHQDAARSSESAEELTLRVAACREAYEEASVLLARDSEGRAAPWIGSTNVTTKNSLPELLRRNGWLLAVEQLTWWSRWVTPDFAPRRFDTYFFVAPMPENQRVCLDPDESDQAQWLGLSDLDSWRTAIGAPPTWLTLLELRSRYEVGGSLEALLRGAPPVSRDALMVKMRSDPEGWTVLLPWDHEYVAAPGGGVDLSPAARERFASLPSRIAMRREPA